MPLCFYHPEAMSTTWPTSTSLLMYAARKRSSAVGDLIARGADVEVTLSQQRMDEWATMDAPCKLSQHKAWGFWALKMLCLCGLRAAPEAIDASLFGLIHLAVRHQHTPLACCFLMHRACARRLCCKRCELTTNTNSCDPAGNRRIHQGGALPRE